MTFIERAAASGGCTRGAAFAAFVVAALSSTLGNEARADAFLNDWCFNINGQNVASNACNQGGTPSLPANVDASNFDFTSIASGPTFPPGVPNALGSVRITLGPGLGQFVLAYMDYDLNFNATGSFSDFGTVHGSLPAGVSFELDDPNSGSLFGDFAANALTDQNNVAVPGGPPDQCCDVAWSLGIGGIDVAPGTQAIVTFTVSATQPNGGFYLEQTNVTPQGANGESIYLGASVVGAGGPEPVPEPASLPLLATGLLALRWSRGRSEKRRAKDDEGAAR